MTVSFKGYDEKTATFKTQGLCSPGHTVAMADNATVKPCGDADDFIGVCVNVKGEYACVQLGGYAQLAFTGDTAPTVGFCALTADGKGGVCVAESGRTLLVTDVDAAGKTVGVIL